MNERGGDANGRGAVAEKTSEPPPSKVEALDGSNYEEWSGRMRSAFKRYKLLKIAVGEEKMPEEGEARERWIEKSAVLFDLILQSVNKEMFEHIKDLVEADDSGPRAWKLLRDVVQPNTLPMVIVLEKELAAISMRPGDDVKPVLDKIKDSYARMAAAGSSVSQLQQCTKIISVLDNSWDNLIPTLNSQQDQWTPEWLRQQILQEDFRRRHVGGGAATKTAEGYGAAGRGKGRGGWRGRGRGRSFGRGRGREFGEGWEPEGLGGERGSEGDWELPYMLGDQVLQVPLQQHYRPAKTPLALVHMDVVGPTRAPSLSGSRYFLTIVDDHTRAVWVYPLKSKGEVAAAVLKEWMPRAQRECGHKKLTVARDVKFLESLYYKEWKQQQQKLPSTPLIVEADEVQRPPRQVEVAVSEEEMSGVTEEGGAAEVEQQQQQQHESPPRVPHPPERPRRDVRPPVRLTYGGRGKPNVVQAGSVVEQIEEDEIAHCYWAPIPEPKTREEALNGPNGEKWKASEDEEFGSLIENETWDLCDLPPGKKAITSKMIYRHKYGPEGELTRYKSRLVAKGF
ncbi:hypothetical protein CLOP_g23198 [Closterium sp. NIES-67]|nr:hypothetical protein CLOP_g23198 [Closterium sp. NIES-67]